MSNIIGSKGLPGPTSWNRQQVSRRVTEPTNFIITKTALRTPKTELCALLLKGLNSLSHLFQSLTVKFKRALPCSRQPLVSSKNGTKVFQFYSYAELETILKSISSVCSTFQVHNIFDAIHSKHSDVQLIDRISYCETMLRIVTMRITAREKEKSVITKSVEEIIFSTELSALGLNQVGRGDLLAADRTGSICHSRNMGDHEPCYSAKGYIEVRPRHNGT